MNNNTNAEPKDDVIILTNEGQKEEPIGGAVPPPKWKYFGKYMTDEDLLFTNAVFKDPFKN